MKAHETEKSSMKAAFTLVELMVVIGLMALLGTVSVTGYFAAARGMAERAARQDTVALIRQAMQVCLIDQTPTAVLFFNRQTKLESNSKDKASSGNEAKASGAGVAIAVKMAGRISYRKGDLIVDEFADWNQSCPVTTSSSGNDVGIPFYRMSDLDGQVKQGIDKCRSYVSTAVEPVDFNNEYMIAYGDQVQRFCDDFKKRPQDNKRFSGTTYNNGNNQRWGHRIKQANGITWNAGDAYGVEIGKLELPKGFLYGSKVANSTKVDPAGALVFRPTDLASADAYEMSLSQTITISVFRGQNAKSIGTITSRDLKDEAE